MAKARRIKTKTTGVYRVGERYEWRTRTGRGMADSYDDACKAKARAAISGPVVAAVREGFGDYAGPGWPDIRDARLGASPRAHARATVRA